MFVPLVQYVVISAYQQDKKAVGWFVLHPTAQSLAITMSVLCEYRRNHFEWLQQLTCSIS